MVKISGSLKVWNFEIIEFEIQSFTFFSKAEYDWFSKNSRLNHKKFPSNLFPQISSSGSRLRLRFPLNDNMQGAMSKNRKTQTSVEKWNKKKNAIKKRKKCCGFVRAELGFPFASIEVPSAMREEFRKFFFLLFGFAVNRFLWMNQ